MTAPPLDVGEVGPTHVPGAGIGDPGSAHRTDARVSRMLA